MSEFGDDFAMQQAPAGNDVDPLDVLNDVLREAMTRRETFAHDWGSAVFGKSKRFGAKNDCLTSLVSFFAVTNRDGTGMNIPDVEQFLANAPEPLMAGSKSTNSRVFSIRDTPFLFQAVHWDFSAPLIRYWFVTRILQPPQQSLTAVRVIWVQSMSALAVSLADHDPCASKLDTGRCQPV